MFGTAAWTIWPEPLLWNRLRWTHSPASVLDRYSGYLLCGHVLRLYSGTTAWTIGLSHCSGTGCAGFILPPVFWTATLGYLFCGHALRPCSATMFGTTVESSVTDLPLLAVNVNQFTSENDPANQKRPIIKFNSGKLMHLNTRCGVRTYNYCAAYSKTCTALLTRSHRQLTLTRSH